MGLTEVVEIIKIILIFFAVVIICVAFDRFITKRRK